MANEALMQMIGQRPGMVLSGLAGARDEASERRMFELARSQNIAQGILQAMGLWTDQQRFGEQMDFAKEGRAFDQGMAERGMGLQETQAGLDAALKQGDIERAKIMNARLNEILSGQIEGQEAQNQLTRFNTMRGNTMLPGEIEGQRLQNEATGFGTQRGRMLLPGQLTEQQQDLQMGEENLLGASQAREQGRLMFSNQMRGAELGIQGQEADLEAQRLNADWQKRFGAAKTEDDRYQIIGENPQAWLEMTLTGQKIAAQGAADQAKAGTPQDYALKELAQVREKMRTTAVTKATPMGGLLGDDAAAAAGKEAQMIDAAINAINGGQFTPNAGESPQAFLGRVLTTLLGSGAAPNAPGAPAIEDDPFGVNQ